MFGGKKMKKIASIAIIAVVVGVFAACNKSERPQADASGEWTWGRRVTIVSPWGPGGGLGPVIRNIIPELEKIIGVPVEVQHVEGGGGLQGTVFASRQPADGYTFVAGTQSTVSLDIRQQLGFDFRKEFVPVGKLVHSTKGIIASKTATQGMFSDFQGFIDYIRANPGKLSVGMRSPGGSDEVSLIEVLALALDVSIAEAREFVRIVPFASGSEQDAALAGGHVHLTVQGFNESPGLVDAGTAIPIVAFSPQRMASFPDVPSTGELGIPSYIGTWRGIFARRGTPQAAIDALAKALEEAWHTDSYQAFCEKEGYLEREGFEGPDGFLALVDEEYGVMTEFLRAAGVIR